MGENMFENIHKNDLGYYQVVDKPDKKELKKYYKKKYYQEARGSYQHEYTDEQIKYFYSKIEQYYARIIKISPHVSRGAVLDVGCGEGFGLSFFQKRGFSVKGIDYSLEGVKNQNPECLEACVQGDLFELLDAELNNGNKYDIVWCTNVLEHVIEPRVLLQKLRALIKKGGLALIKVPNDFSIIQQEALDKKHIDNAFWVCPPDHLSYFNYRGLVNIVEHCGFCCIDILADFPVDLFLLNPSSCYIKDPDLGKNAHKVRVSVENLLSEQSTNDVNSFYSYMAKVGLGRDLTAFLTADD